MLIFVVTAALPCLTMAQHSKVIDTDFSKGQLRHVQTVRYKDLVRFHGHSCDGLLEGMQALQLALQELYLEGPVDRTNTRVVSKPSPCLADAAIFLTGARGQYNTFYVDDQIDGLYIVQRVDNGLAVCVSRNAGVKPPAIDSLGALAVAQRLSYGELQLLRRMEEDYARQLKKTAPADNFSVTLLENYEWCPSIKTDYVKTDTINKNKKD